MHRKGLDFQILPLEKRVEIATEIAVIRIAAISDRERVGFEDVFLAIWVSKVLCCVLPSPEFPPFAAL